MEPIDRRRFLTQNAAVAVATGANALDVGIVQAVQNEVKRQLGTCGPPPQKNPERQTSAEAAPPLPLPVVPLRRSEPKAEPAPPLMIAKLEYGTTQDWNTDPGDIDSLMRHVRSALGLWYGWRVLNLNDLVAMHQRGQRLKIPALYLSGHDPFSFTDAQREALRQYVFDGGTLIGDACCGRIEFTQSFQAEIKKLFPDRPLELLELDHPLFRAYYKYQMVYRRDGDKGQKDYIQELPRFYGMMLGCRTAVLLSPFDLSCGWDKHEHPHGARLAPDDAIRVGINLIAYVAALRSLAETQAVTREISATADRPRHLFTLAQLRHHGEWNPDPNSSYQLLRHLANESSLAVSFDLKFIDPVDTRIAPYPFLYLTGFRDPRFSDDEITALRRHLQAGGFLFINNPSGYAAFDKHIRDVVKRLFPDQRLTALDPKTHPLFRALHTISEGRDRQSGQPRPIELEGIPLRQRTVLVYSKNDMVTHLKQVSDPFGNGYDAETCRKLAVNVVAYALQG